MIYENPSIEGIERKKGAHQNPAFFAMISWAFGVYARIIYNGICTLWVVWVECEEGKKGN